MKFCSLLLFDVPENTEIGIDLKFWRVGKIFKGIKDIPLGFHYLYSSAVNSESISGQRVGYLEYFDKPGYVAKKWMCDNEEDDMERFNLNNNEINAYLGPYPMESYRDWIALTNFITPSIVARIRPTCGRIYSCPQFLSQSSNTKERLAAKVVIEEDLQSLKPEERLPNIEIIPETKIHFLNIPSKPIYPVGSSSSKITDYCMDQTYTLNSIIQPLIDESSSNLELDAAMELVDHILTGWEHWRCLFKLMANSELAVRQYPQLYTSLITALYHQLVNVNKSKENSSFSTSSSVEVIDMFFSQATTSDDTGIKSCIEPQFLPTMLHCLLTTIRTACSNVDGCESGEGVQLLDDLYSRAESFGHFVKNKFKWTTWPDSKCPKSDIWLSDGEMLVDDVDWDGDEAPVIVEL